MEELLVVEAKVDEEEGGEDVLDHHEDERDYRVLLDVVLVSHDAVVGEDRREQNENRSRYYETGEVKQLQFEILVNLRYSLVDLKTSLNRRKAIAGALDFDFSGEVFICDGKVDARSVSEESNHQSKVALESTLDRKVVHFNHLII